MVADNISNPGSSVRPEALSPGWCGCWWWSQAVEDALQRSKVQQIKAED